MIYLVLLLISSNLATAAPDVKNWLPLSNKEVASKTQPSETSSASTEATEAQTFVKFIELDKGNHVVLRGPVTEESVTRLIVDFANVDEDDVVLYITSPGGSVLAGLNLIQHINYMQQRGHKVHCVTDFAASMAFAILQACDERYVTPGSVIMQHQMSVGLEGQLLNVKSRQRLLNSMEEDMTRSQAARLKMTTQEFTELITSDWWLYGQEAVDRNAADKVIQVGCTRSLLESTVQTTMYVRTFLGTMPVEVYYSGCPVARQPLKYVVDKVYTNLTDGDRLMVDQEIRNHFGTLYNVMRVAAA